MFASRIGRPEIKAADSPTRKLAPQRSTAVARPFGVWGKEAGGDHQQEAEATLDRAAPRGLDWSLSWISILPPDAPPSAPALSRPPTVVLKPKLAIGSVDDPLEREADRVADQVTRMTDRGAALTAAPPRVSRKCAACEEEQKLQKKEAGPQAAVSVAPANVHEVLSSPGQPLDAASRAYFEPRFGYDFSRVRVHADSKAAESARAVNALAYTTGSDVVFGSGQYSPMSSDGRRLLAHELAHVVQQATAQPSASRLRREPDQKPKQEQKPRQEQKPEQAPEKKPKPRKDVVLLGEGWKGGRELSVVLANGGTIYQVNSVEEAAKTLAKIDGPIGTLYFVTHSLNSGALKFGKDEGFIKAADIASKLKGSLPVEDAPQTVDFRGCSVGSSPKAMEDIRTALGAQSVVAGNCYAVIDLSTPIKMGKTGHLQEITNSVQITKENRKIFEKLYRETYNTFAKAFGGKTGCIVTKSEKDFFSAGGRFVALWFNSDFTADWVAGKSVCYNEAAHEIVDPAKPATATEGCHVITVEAPKTNTTKTDATKTDTTETKP